MRRPPERRRINRELSLLALAAAFVGAAMSLAPSPARGAPSAGIFPNDAGPEEVDVSGYPEEVKKGYRLMLTRCSACHKVARPLNAQYVELTDEEIKKAQGEQPGIFKNKLIWDIAPKTWSRFVHRMMLKPGARIKPDEGKAIYEFLVYDAKVRKTGGNAETWRKHREDLLQQFAKENPDAYKSLFAAAGSSGQSSGEKK